MYKDMSIVAFGLFGMIMGTYVSITNIVHRFNNPE